MKTDKSQIANREWFKLDNAAKIFPGQITKSWSNIIRDTITLKENIRPEQLEKALKAVLPRFPMMGVRMRRGLFWYYLEKNNKEPIVRPDTNNPCIRIRFSENNGYLFRVFYYNNRISLEVFHALTDGFGSSVFLCTLAAEYLRLSGHEIPVGGMVYDINEKPKPEEFEESFVKHAIYTAKIPRATGNVYHYKAEKLPVHRSHVITGIIPVDKLKAVAKSYGATITEFSVAVLMEQYLILQKETARNHKTVSIQVPVNARNQFPSHTLRNFSVCYEMRLDPTFGDYSFPEIVKQTSLYLRYINNPKTLGAIFGRNLKLESSPWTRALPLVIKDFGVAISFLLSAEKSTTGIFTNLGPVKAPAELIELSESFIMMPSPGVRNGGRIGAATIGNTMTMTFADSFNDTTVERLFFTRLVKLGIPVKIESNF